MKVRATDLRDHPKGRQFDMVTEVGDALEELEHLPQARGRR